MTTFLKLPALMKSFLPTCCFALCCVTLSLAQGTTSLSGSVKDGSGAALTGATVTALNTASGNDLTTTADAAGNYEFTGLAAGPYRVTARVAGFNALGVSVILSDGQKLTQDFTLTPGALEDEITITAAKGQRSTSEIPLSVTVATAEDIEARRPQGVHEIYERAPSLRAIDPNPYRTRPEIRGLRSARLLIVVDGERLNNARFSADFVGVSPSLVDPSEIQTAEVIGGAASSLHGSDAVGGTINLTTRAPERERDGQRFSMKFNGDFGSNGRSKRESLSAMYGANKWAIRGNISGFDYGNYTMGGEAVSRAAVLRFGQFAADVGALIGQTVISNYTVYELPANWKVPFSGANGESFGGDFMLFPNDKQTLRIKGNINRFTNLDVPFGGPPTSINNTSTGYSDFDKISARYEIRELAGWFPRLSASYFWQDYDRVLNERRFGINLQTPTQSSSYANIRNPGCPAAPAPCFLPDVAVYTGNLSTFGANNFTDTENRNKTIGFDIQGNFIPVSTVLYITGVNYSRDRSADVFTQLFPTVIAGTVNAPNTEYKNIGWYNQLEYSPISWMKLSGGFRVDNWKTKANPTTGYPTTKVGAILTASLPLIRQNPGPININGLDGLDQIIAGQKSLTTDNTVNTWNVAVNFPTRYGVIPYFRYATSYREPDLTSRFLLRSFFSSPVLFDLVGLTNTQLRAEKGRNIDTGVKFDRQRFRGSVGYYRNDIKDATSSVTGSACIPVNPAQGILASVIPPCAATRTHLVQLFQTINFARVKIEGIELQGEASLSLGNAGSLTPYISYSRIRGTNQTPDSNRIAIINSFYNRSDTPLKLKAGSSDVPFYSLPTHQGSFAPRFNSRNGRWWAEYEFRWVSDITRPDPNDLGFGQTTQYQTFRAFDGIEKHSIRGGFSFGEEYPIRVTMGVDNLTDKLYFLPIQPAAAPGRSFTIGTTIGLNKKIK